MSARNSMGVTSMRTTRCEECSTPVAYDDLRRDGYGAYGSCPQCSAMIIRPRRLPIQKTGPARTANGMSAA
jgi:NAD-dependent SIR2 family protein deacetylase